MHVYTTGQWLYVMADSTVDYCNYVYTVDERGP
jgi:hypothetical protein